MASILVVDDEADMRLALRNVLAQAGHSVEEAGDGPAALARAERGGLDLVLLDIRLPGMDGKQILRQLREKVPALPVIMVSGYGSVDSAVEVLRLGASHYLSKPFSNKDLLEAVSNTLKGVAAPFQGQEEGVLRRRLKEKISEAAAVAVAEPPRAAAAPSVVEPPRARWPRPLAGLALAGAVLAGALFLRGGASRPGRPAYALAGAHPTALVWVGDRLWTADWVAQTVTEHKLQGDKLSVVRSVKLPGSHLTGLALIGDRLYAADSWRKVIEVRRLDAALSLVDSVPSPAGSPSGLFWDGRYLWSVDAAAGRFYQHDVETRLTVLASYKSPGRTPSSLYRDSRFLWSADADTRTLFQHRLDNELRVVARYNDAALDAGNQPLSCFAWRDGWLWLARDGSPELIRRRLESFRKS